MTTISHINKRIKTLRDLLYLKSEKDLFLAAFRAKEKKGDYRVYSPELFDAANKIGAFSYVATGTIVTDCEIGKFTSIGPNCTIGYGQHPTQWASTSPAFYSTVKIFENFQSDKSHYKPQNEKITIGNDVWIGAHVYIKNGVCIGDGAVVGAGSVVVKDVAPYDIVGGVPAELIRPRFEKQLVEELLALRWWDKDPALLKKLRLLFVSDDLRAFISELKKHES